MMRINFKEVFISLLTANYVSAESFPDYKKDPQHKSNGMRAQYMSNLMKKALPTDNSKIRNLDEAEVDITGYEVKFEKCQFVKVYSDDFAMDEDNDSVLDLQKFVLFRLCPAGTCNNCAYDYGEYAIDMESYLEATIDYFQDWEENMCDQCEEVCAADDDDAAVDDAAGDDAGDDGNERRRLDIQVDCDTCTQYCEKVETMEENGFLEASDYVECQQIFESDDGAALYAGGMCSSNGEKIKIGVFTDQYCAVLQNQLDVDDFLGGYKLSHALLKNIYSKDSCVSCAELNWDIPNDDRNANDDEIQLTDMCEQIYEGAAKCESIFGFDNYWKGNEDYVNQYQQEDDVCEFISSLKNGNYAQDGEISLSGVMYNVGNSEIKIGQVLFLVFYGLGTIGLGIYAGKLHRELKSRKQTLLSAQGNGALA